MDRSADLLSETVARDPDAGQTASQRLEARPSRAPDYRAENAALATLLQNMAQSSDDVLQGLVEAALDLCKAGSAGISLLADRDGQPVFVWRAIAGRWAGSRGATIARAHSPSGAVLDRDCALLMTQPGRYYPIPENANAPALEVLLVPFRSGARAVGTIWLISHDESCEFEREDLRVLTSLSQFAAAAYQLLELRESQSRSQHTLASKAVDLERFATASAVDARQKDALYELASRLNRSASQPEVFEAALHAIVNALECERASVLLFDDAGVMRFVAWHGLSEAYRQATEGHSPWQIDAIEPDPICVPDTRMADFNAPLRAAIEQEGISALAFIPLLVEGRLIGKFMAYSNHPRAFSTDDVRLATIIARQLAFAIDRHRAHELLREHTRQLTLITDTAPVFIVYCDTQTRYKFVNESFASRFGLTREACVGRTIAEVIGTMAYNAIEHEVQMALAGEPVEFETLVPYEELSERFMHCSYAPELDEQGNVVAFVGAITDITERRVIEDALRSSEDKLKEADRRKDEFLAMLAHELRNPLAPIANALHLLQRQKIADPIYLQARAILDRQTARLARLVDDLLEVSRITTGRIHLNMERITVQGVVERAVETVRPLIEQRHHELAVSLPSEPLWIHADAARLEQVLVNLVNNAAKYTHDGGHLRLEVTREGTYGVLRVTDDGIGIDAELLPSIFELFTQAERSLDRADGGLGIGLSLVQRLVSMHSGTVEARSVAGEGSEFTVRLPAIDTPRRGGAAMREHDNQHDSTALRILVVDDNVDAARSLTLLLCSLGHDVRTEHDGLSAVATSEEFAPHVTFLDIGLPGIDGYEVARRLRALVNTAPRKIVAVTGYGQRADRDRALRAGFDDHLTKPADWSRVQRILADTAASLRKLRTPES